VGGREVSTLVYPVKVSRNHSDTLMEGIRDSIALDKERCSSFRKTEASEGHDRLRERKRTKDQALTRWSSL